MGKEKKGEGEMGLRKNFHVINWIRIGVNVSWKLSRLSLSTILYFLKPFQSDRRFEKVREKHAFILNYLDHIYHDDITKYVDNSADLQCESVDRHIWVFWNTGEASMPPLVKLCQESLKKHANGANVHLLTMDNLHRYISIPRCIMDKYAAGRMTLAFLTDYIRISLLEKYGGLWLDATILVTQDIPAGVFQKPLYSLHTEYEKTIFVNDNKIHCYVLGGMNGYSFFTYIRNELEKYWAEHDFMIDYYLLDYTIMHAYFNNDSIRHVIDSLSYTSSSLYEIMKIIDEPAEGSKLRQLEDENVFSKLNWRVIPKMSHNGKVSVYEKLCKEMGSEKSNA